jgi:hypothetical protein
MGRTIQGILSVHRQKVNFTGAGRPFTEKGVAHGFAR